MRIELPKLDGLHSRHGYNTLLVNRRTRLGVVHTQEYAGWFLEHAEERNDWVAALILSDPRTPDPVTGTEVVVNVYGKTRAYPTLGHAAVDIASMRRTVATRVDDPPEVRDFAGARTGRLSPRSTGGIKS